MPEPDSLREAEAWIEEHPDAYTIEDLRKRRDPDTGETIGKQWREPEAHRGRRVSSYDAWTTGPNEDGYTTNEEVLAAKRGELPWLVNPTQKLSPREKVINRLWRARLEYLISFLLPHRQEIVREHYLMGRTLADIARDRGVTYQAIQNQLRVAVGNLRRVLAERRKQLMETNVEEV